MPEEANFDSTNIPPLETADLRRKLSEFLDMPVTDPVSGKPMPVGNFRWGVYAFFDYDGEPIYVGQTNERLRTRIRRHLTNQRTDAVAMSVLDPFEVAEIEVWPLPQFEKSSRSDQAAKDLLNALEEAVYQKAIAGSKFGAVLNEKNPPPGNVAIDLSVITSYRGSVVSKRVRDIRAHPDFRIARRALVISRLAQVIAERKVQVGLRRVLLIQAKRLQWLADRRFFAMGGENSVPEEGGEEAED